MGDRDEGADNAHEDVNGAELHYEMSGEGIPLVLVHGGWIDATSWDLVVPAFADHYQVLTYDRRGHSRSQPPTGWFPPP